MSRKGISADDEAADFDLLADIWPDIPVAANTRALSALPSHRGRRALDIGCGTGRMLPELSLHFDTVIGVDLSLRMVLSARGVVSRGRRYLAVTDLRSAGLRPRSFDCVFAHTIVHHVSELVVALAALRELVAPGGELIIIDIVDSIHHRFPVLSWCLNTLVSGMFDFSRGAFRLAFRRCRAGFDPRWLAHVKQDRFFRQPEIDAALAAELPDAHCHFLRLETGFTRYFVVRWRNECAGGAP